MKRFLATTATALILSNTAYADGHTASFKEISFDASTNLNASELIGMRVYATEADINNETRIAADDEKEWDDIGEINEIVLTRDGAVQSVIVGVGGFLSIGEKDVAIDMSQLKFVSEADAEHDYFLVVNANVAGVKDAPSYKRGIVGKTERDTANGRPLLAAPTMERAGYATARVDDLTTEDLTGARVYGKNDEDVGEISELLLKDDGAMDRAIIDVGGFLGIGERPVAVTFDELQIMRGDEGSSLRVYIESSQEALEQQPEYKG